MVNFLKEHAWLHKFRTSVSETALDMRNHAPLLGTGNSNIHQPPFLLKPAWRVHAHLAWEDGLFSPDDIYRLEFQSLGGMDSHQ